MKIFEPIAVDEKINKSLIRSLNKVTHNNFQLSKVNNYAYHCKNKRSTLGKTTRNYLYLLLNEYSRQMYMGITRNIKDRLIGHSKDKILGPNDEVILNALFIMDLEDFSTDNQIFSVEGQMMSIELKLTKLMQNLGFNVRCQYNELNVQTENGFLLEKIESKLVKQKVEEELQIIKSFLEGFIRMAERGEYYYFSFPIGEVHHKCTMGEQLLLQRDAEICKMILTKKTSEYDKSDWEFIRKCLLHKGFRISLWELGINDIDNFIVFQQGKLNYD